jgi:hypothetical protein
MIYILAADLHDAREWAGFRVKSAEQWTYVGYPGALRGARLSEVDQIARTARWPMNPSSIDVEARLGEILGDQKLTETLHGGLVRQQ